MAENIEVYDELPKPVVTVEEVYATPSTRVDIRNDESKLSKGRITMVQDRGSSTIIIPKVDYQNPIIYRWLGILILLGGILIFITEILLISRSCYGHWISFYIGTWVSWFVIITGILQIRLSEHYADITLMYQIITLIISSLTITLLFIGFLLSLILRSTNICTDLVIIMIFEITLTIVPVLISEFCFVQSFIKMKARLVLNIY